MTGSTAFGGFAQTVWTLCLLRSTATPCFWPSAGSVGTTAGCRAGRAGQARYRLATGAERGGPGFYIAQYPVTQAQFQAFIDAEDGYADPRWWKDFDERKGNPWKPTWPEPNAPRTDVDWFEAVAFCRWLTHCGHAPTAGWQILLPTDEQWRQAYVGEGKSEFPWTGEPDPNRHANYRDTGLKRTSAVGVFPDGVASSGALDMAGNVWEWCLEKYDLDTGRVGPAMIDAANDRRVLRGGSWSNAPGDLRSAPRFGRDPVDRRYYLGFRLVCRPPSSTDH